MKEKIRFYICKKLKLSEDLMKNSRVFDRSKRAVLSFSSDTSETGQNVLEMGTSAKKMSTGMAVN